MNRKFDREKYLAAFTVVGEGANDFAKVSQRVSPRRTVRYLAQLIRTYRMNGNQVPRMGNKPSLCGRVFANLEAEPVAILRHVWRFRRLAYAEARR